MRFRILAATAVMLAASISARADSVVYSFNRTIGSETATGTITTDGTLGSLSTNNITGFTLKLINGNTTVTSTSDAFDLLIGNPLTATLSDLYFDYASEAGGFALITDSSASSYLCFAAADISCSGNGPSNIEVSVAGTSTTSGAMSGSVSIAQAATPEPSSLALLSTGTLGVLGAARRRRAL